MHYRYEDAVKVTIPAVRIAVAIALSKEHGMSETVIANRLGVAQAAVSKYLSGRYSARIGRLVRLIIEKKMHVELVNAINLGQKRENIAILTDKIASNRMLMERAAGKVPGIK